MFVDDVVVTLTPLDRAWPIPTKMWITATEALRRVSEAPGMLIVKVVPVRRRGRSNLPAEDLLDIQSVSIVTYS
jgi:hypothetical protein